MGNTYAYDIETFGNFLSYIFIRIPDPGEDTPEEVWEFVVFEDRDDRRAMGDWIRQNRPQLAGFNNYAFDDLLLAGTLLYPDKNPRAVYDLGQKLIAREYSEIGVYNKLRGARDRLETIDLMLLLGNNYNSLKEIEAKLGLPIKELPLDHTAVVTPEAVPEILEYNRHDVRATIALYRELLPVIETRQGIGKEFGIHALSSTDSSLANDILNKLYRRPEVQSTPRDSVKLGDIISQRVTFEDRELSETLERLRELTLTAGNKFRFSERIALGGNNYRLGIGGLHSEDNPGVFRSGETLLRDCDVSSYYPAMMLELKIYPAHLGPGFLEFYRGMVEKRLEAKAKGDRVTADALKIAINSVFGKMGYEFFWLYDPKAFLTVTINGQLFLLDLIEKLEEAGIKTISANTDGILCAIPPELEEAYTAVCSAWQERTGFSLEFTDYRSYIRRDVNNYLALTEDGRIKAKGLFIEKRSLSDSFRAPIIARAIREYFLQGTPPEETLGAEKSPLPFCYVFKPGKKFAMVYETPKGEEIEAPRVNRYLITKSGGTLVKVSGGRRDRVRVQPMILLNGELPAERPEDIDLEFYLEEAKKTIEKIEGTAVPPLLALINGDHTAVKTGASLLGDMDLERLSEAAKTAPKERTEGPRLRGLESSYSVTEIADSMGALPEGDSYRAPCPVHEGKDSRSLKITERDGRIDLYCFAGCDPEEVLKEIEKRLDSGEEFRRPEAEALGELITTYEYRDEFGRISFRKHRYEPKTFRIDSYDPESGGFLPGINGHRPILYRYPEVRASEKVIIVEGEKDVENGRLLGLEGYSFTCNFDGAGKWARAYSQALAGKEIVIIPDNDPPGKDHGRKVTNSIAPFAKSVKVLELPEGKDLSDWIALGHTAEDLLEIIERAGAVKPGELFEEQDLLDYPIGDPGNARSVIRLYGDRIAYTDGFGPMYYERGFWTMGGTAEAEINKAIEDTLWRRREAALKTRDIKYEPISKGAYPSSSRINSTWRMVKNYVTVTEERFRNPPGLINVKNGVIDMRTGALYPPHSEYGFTYRLEVPYIPGARSEVWEEFLGETLPDPEEREYLQELFGYVFTGETREEIVVYISGPTRSGKGSFTESLQYLGGPLAHEISMRTLIDSSTGGGQNFDLAPLHHARFVHASESKDSDWLDSAKLKALSGGNSIPASFKGKDHFTYRPEYTVVITSNEPPKMKAEDSAAWYRLRAIEFPISKAGSEDKRLKTILREPEHITAVLNWLIEGAIRWYGRPQGLITPQSVKERTEAFREALDYIGEFLQEHYEISEDMANWEALREAEFYTPLDSVYELYRSWYEDNGAPDLKKTTFGGKVRQRLGGINLYTNQCRVRIEDSLTGDKKLTRVLAGVRPRKVSGKSTKVGSSHDDIAF